MRNLKLAALVVVVGPCVWACAGATGDRGPEGVPGATGSTGGQGVGLAMATAAEGPGPCAAGGTRLEFGRDLDADGVLDDGERNDAFTSRVCNGPAATLPADSAFYIQNRQTPQGSAHFSIDGTGSAALLEATGVGTTASPPGAALMARDGNGNPRFKVDVNGGLVAMGTYDGGAVVGDVPREGPGTRMLWYPQKGAFRAGVVSGTQWDEANIGTFSFAAGEDTTAPGDHAIAFGFQSTAAATNAFAAGDLCTASGAASVALGYHASTNSRQGTFVFADRSTTDVLNAGVNHSANFRVSGGLRVFTASNLTSGVTIQSGASVSNWGQSNAVISTSTGAYLSTGGIWVNTSDIRRKHHFEDVSKEEVLVRLQQLPITRWTYRVEEDRVRHLGPTAQDFKTAFGLGDDETGIGSVDADGVALASAQALAARTDALRTTVDELKSENARLREQLSAVEARLREVGELLERQGDGRR